MPLRVAEDPVDLLERRVVSDSVVSRLALEGQKDGLRQAGQLDAVGQTLKIADSEPGGLLGQLDQAAVDDRHVAARAKLRRCVEGPRDVAYDRSGADRDARQRRPRGARRRDDDVTLGDPAHVEGDLDLAEVAELQSEVSERLGV